MTKLKDFVKCFRNKANNQHMLTIRSRKLKEFDIKLDDLLDIDIKKKLKRFGNG